MSSQHLFSTFHTKKINVFFDESGKIGQRPNLLGAISIPRKIYQSEDIQKLNQLLKEEQIKIHWNKYNGFIPYKKNITDLINTFSEYRDYIKLNIINYHHGFLNSQQLFQKEHREHTIYSKFPERIIYGLIRGYGSETAVEADIFIDKATEYERIGLKETILNTLNAHSLYRGEKFVAKDCFLYPKNTEIGLELIDVLLGLMRIIILNTSPQELSKAENAKVSLTIELLENEALKNLLSEVKYYEWRGHNQLTRIDFIDYIYSFLIQHKY
ncbi:hypothetical protein [Bacillus velezensis]|uniref:hypothetical protein n=1 Tax=Bacillus velezensis TaxID=492670 RepID=UPI00083CF352|nr:hypothetical protein [Bacillus velezensis]ODB74124.1 hypothetical protein A7310_17875 [Bacillus velezensis]